MTNIFFIKDAINLALRKGISFYACRLPNDRNVHFGAQVDSEFCAAEGFRIVPFVESAETSTRLIYAQYDAESAQKILQSLPEVRLREIPRQSTSREEYHVEFSQAMRLLVEGSLKKVVLSRTILHNAFDMNWGQIFCSLTKQYPSAFVFVFYTPESGAWMGASPEILGTLHGSEFRTMSLAGTRVAGSHGAWGAKELEEQQYVTAYIADLFKKESVPYEASSRYTRNAGTVEHICNDFVAHFHSRQAAMQFIDKLYPTPALAGMPKDAAIRAVSSIETHRRDYYGGYVGLFYPDGFDYFVNLRSLQFDGEHSRLFVGGGLTIDSGEDSEWQETASKAQTLLNFL